MTQAPLRRLDRLLPLCALAYAGMVIIAVARAAHVGFTVIYGGPILAVDPGGPAAAAGMRAGDLVVMVDGQSTPTPRRRQAALSAIRAGAVVELVAQRGSTTRGFRVQTARGLPLGSATGALAALGLLIVASLARQPVRRRNAALYVVFIAGTLVCHTLLRSPWLALPMLLAMTLVGPATCHAMILHPLGRPPSPRTLLLLYGPALLLGLAQGTLLVLFTTGAIEAAEAWGRAGLRLTVALAAVTLTAGAVLRFRRMRRRRAEIDPIALRWFAAGGVATAAPLVACGIWQVVSPDSCLGSGYRPLVGFALAGGTLCVSVALSREREVVRGLRRGAGYLYAVCVAAALALLGLALFSGARSVAVGPGTMLVSGGFLAGLVLAPLCVWLQRSIDDRFQADNARSRRLLREASGAADAESSVTAGCREALRIDGCALYVEDEQGFRRASLAGDVALPERLTGDGLREMGGRLLAVPVPVPGVRDAALVVAPGDDSRAIDEEDRELLSLAASELAATLVQTRDRTALRRLGDRLRDEVARSERRRREIVRLRRRLDADRAGVESEVARAGGSAPVIGPGLQATFDLALRFGRTESTVLVSGETGTGKELVARAVHAASSRRAGPFVVFDCGAVSRGVFESALAGQERGAFTGAWRATPGSVRAAGGGTLFLDEIGELPLELQPKLLRMLEKKEVVPVGADLAVPVDVRVVAATHRDLKAEARAGRFREDLLYRLCVLEIAVPPLRARKADLPALAASFLPPGRSLATDALEALSAHAFPGNVRELQHVLAAALVTAGPEIRAADLNLGDDAFRRRAAREVAREDGPGLRETLSALERQRLLDVLREHGGNRAAAARALGYSRAALRRRIARYGLG